jgi:hypothetical protein
MVVLPIDLDVVAPINETSMLSRPDASFQLHEEYGKIKSPISGRETQVAGGRQHTWLLSMKQTQSPDISLLYSALLYSSLDYSTRI